MLTSGDELLVRLRQFRALRRHQANLGLDFKRRRDVRLGADLNWRSGVYLRGDEINAAGQDVRYARGEPAGEYRFSDPLSVFARVENLFDTDYETFGLLGEPDEVFAEFEEPAFYGAGPPLRRLGWACCSGLHCRLDARRTPDPASS